VDGLLYQLHIKILAAHAHATSIVQDQGKIGIRLPYLGKVDRYQLQGILGSAAKVSRTAIWIDLDDNDDVWMSVLLTVLGKIQIAPEEIQE